MMCEHGRQRYQCKDCRGGRICEHDRRKDLCNPAIFIDICHFCLVDLIESIKTIMHMSLLGRSPGLEKFGNLEVR